MKQNTTRVICCVCNHTIEETNDIHQSVVELAQKNKLAEIEIKNSDKKFKAGGYLCPACFSILSSADSLKKIVKTTTGFGNSSQVILPRDWLGKKVIVYLIE
jgi:hypothetical protein